MVKYLKPFILKENDMTEQKAFKAYIKLIKTLQGNNVDWQKSTLVSERLIYANDKSEVKHFLKTKYPEFFPDGKVFEKESKTNPFQFSYVLIYELQNHEIIALNGGSWTCAGCGQTHSDRYTSPPKTYSKLGDKYEFCNPRYYSDPDEYRHEFGRDDPCLKLFRSSDDEAGMMIDDHRFIRPDAPTYIYKITEKSTGKCYIGKTRNAPVWRWWQHLTSSSSPFGIYLRQTDLKNWTFEVLDELHPSINDQDVFKIESQYILDYSSIENGFNVMVSSKNAEKGE